MDDERAYVLLKNSFRNVANEIVFRSREAFGTPDNPPNPETLKADTAAFRYAGLWGMGAGAACFGASSLLARQWRLLYRIPFVTVTTFAGIGVGQLYATKGCIQSLLDDVDSDSATARSICPAMRHLQPCLDCYKCKELLESDFGGRTMLEWMVSSYSYNFRS